MNKPIIWLSVSKIYIKSAGNNDKKYNVIHQNYTILDPIKMKLSPEQHRNKTWC